MAAPAHVLAFPWPLQGHINPMLHLASALLDAGLRVTFLHTEHNLRRFTRVPPHHPRLRLLSVPDGLPDDHPRSVDGLMELVESMRTVGSAAYRALLLRTMGSESPDDAVTCVVADGVMPFAISVAEELGVPALAFRTESACGFLAYLSALRHRAVGCFLTHGGWNSTLEAAVEGMPAVCWPFFADQQTNSRFVGAVWRTGLDMKDVCDRAVVERMVRAAMESTEIRASARAMARRLRLDVAEGGSSASELERLVGLITELSAVKPAPA